MLDKLDRAAPLSSLIVDEEPDMRKLFGKKLPKKAATSASLPAIPEQEATKSRARPPPLSVTLTAALLSRDLDELYPYNTAATHTQAQVCASANGFCRL
ncbi:hypothetical protein Y032_0373g172 [Ancylostoma ceylanicum]|uniref:Uncharacterized protein n=1 Tax=Ancylostoma ceylanicum TaxID=53326 RepID=A0A016RU23_9BILA|nr:hypothetical protein Y032_0373g172 [Ancylostoma ceylanicum]